MPKRGTNKAPEFVTESGVTLQLRPIPPLVAERWQSEYKKAHPRPQPPRKFLANGEEWFDREDKTFKEVLADWTEGYNSSFLDFMFRAGILSDPPQGWESAFGLNGTSPKNNWLAEILGIDDIEALSEAIMSINNPTEEAVEEAEKN